MPKGIGDIESRKSKLMETPVELSLKDIRGVDLRQEVAKSRIMDAVAKHVKEDMGKDMMDIDFSLSFGLSL